MKGEKGCQQIGSPALITVITAVLALACSLDAAAQEPRNTGSQNFAAAATTGGGGMALFQAPQFFPSKAAPRRDLTTLYRPADRGLLFEAGGRPSSAPRLSESQWKTEGVTESFAPQPQGNEESLAFTLQQREKYEPRPISPFSEKTSPTMFPGSRLRGPFEQTYPRPFPGGGQP